MRTRYLPDRPIETSGQDRLGFQTAAAETLRQIAASEPPFTWGIFGDWGSGKTSFMRLILELMEQRLERPPSDTGLPLHIPVWFDAWRYENEVNIVYPLFDAIRRDFEDRCRHLAKEKSFADSFKKVATASFLGLTDLALRAATNKAFGEAATLEDVAAYLERADGELQTVFDKWSNNVALLQEDFERFVGTYLETFLRSRPDLGERELYLAVFIDDLDRCLPDVAISILERIKNHLSAQNCIFVLGVNRGVVYQSIRKKYQDLDIDGRQHLEKIIQYSVGVPELDQQDHQAFVVSSLEELVPADERAGLETPFSEFASALYDCGFVNPRKIKRILNRYLSFLSSRTAVADLERFRISAVTRLIVLREYFPDYYQLFREAGFEPFAQIRDFDGTRESEIRFEEAYPKWRRLIPSFPGLRRVARLEGGIDKTAKDYDRSIGGVFGRDD